MFFFLIVFTQISDISQILIIEENFNDELLGFEMIYLKKSNGY
jgi:hypothetical protein